MGHFLFQVISALDTVADTTWKWEWPMHDMLFTYLAQAKVAKSLCYSTDFLSLRFLLWRCIIFIGRIHYPCQPGMSQPTMGYSSKTGKVESRAARKATHQLEMGRGVDSMGYQLNALQSLD